MALKSSLTLLFLSLLIFGCSNSGPVSPSSSSGNVTMSVAFTNANTPVGFKGVSAPSGTYTVSSTTGVDSIRIDSAIVVFANIKFESNIDTVQVSDESGTPYISIDDSNSSITFPGPFVVHISDTVAINFASRTLPAGTYTGIKLQVHRLAPYEHFEDSDDFMGMRIGNPHSDTAVSSYSIVVWGAIYKDSAWVPFAFKDNQNLEIKVKGTFTISSPTSNVNIALNFNMGSWFVNPINGQILDPTDMSDRNQVLIMMAIRQSFQQGHCGRWDDFRDWGD